MRSIRWPFAFLALMTLLAAFALEIGSNWLLLTGTQAGASSAVQSQLGIPSLALIDASFLWTVVLMVLNIALNRALVGKIQGVLSFIISVLIIFAGIKTLISSFVLLLVMIALLSSFFGWAVYVAVFASFKTGSAAIVLGAVTFFKLATVVLLVLAQQDFLKTTRFLVLVAISLVCDLLLVFLQGLPPGFLVSVTDAIGAIIISIVAIIYAIVQLVFAIVAIVRAILEVLRASRTQRTSLDRST